VGPGRPAVASGSRGRRGVGLLAEPEQLPESELASASGGARMTTRGSMRSSRSWRRSDRSSSFSRPRAASR
jgi:hypothetical protein